VLQGAKKGQPPFSGRGLAREELDFIINYDIKYRMGREGLMNEN
jgi:hypothetical protein